MHMPVVEWGNEVGGWRALAKSCSNQRPGRMPAAAGPARRPALPARAGQLARLQADAETESFLDRLLGTDCYSRAVSTLEGECRGMGQEVKARLALQLAACQVATHGGTPPRCPSTGPLKPCLDALGEREWQLYVEFLTHTDRHGWGQGGGGLWKRKSAGPECGLARLLEHATRQEARELSSLTRHDSDRCQASPSAPAGHTTPPPPRPRTHSLAPPRSMCVFLMNREFDKRTALMLNELADGAAHARDQMVHLGSQAAKLAHSAQALQDRSDRALAALDRIRSAQSEAEETAERAQRDAAAAFDAVADRQNRTLQMQARRARGRSGGGRLGVWEVEGKERGAREGVEGGWLSGVGKSEGVEEKGKREGSACLRYPAVEMSGATTPLGRAVVPGHAQLQLRTAHDLQPLHPSPCLALPSVFGALQERAASHPSTGDADDPRRGPRLAGCRAVQISGAGGRAAGA